MIAVQRGVGVYATMAAVGTAIFSRSPSGAFPRLSQTVMSWVKLKFNADGSRLTSREINVTHHPECSCNSGWRDLIYNVCFGEVEGRMAVICLCVWGVVVRIVVHVYL